MNSGLRDSCKEIVFKPLKHYLISLQNLKATNITANQFFIFNQLNYKDDGYFMSELSDGL